MDTSSQKRPRVLVVDDQKNWREALCDMLEPMYEIETAASYDEAVRQLRRCAFHVVVSDQRLVDTDRTNIQGIQLLDEVRALQDGTQAVIVTGYPTIETAREALRGQQAYDYILKYPEEGGPFKIREYRDLVRRAVDLAAQERQKAITVCFSLSTVVPNLTLDLIGKTLFPRVSLAQNLAEDVEKVVNRLLYPLQPLARGMGRSWLSEQDRTFEMLCWSRERGKATLLRIGKKREQRPLDARQTEWPKENWHLVKNDKFTCGSFVGISYMIDGMTFEDFALQAEGN
jgi:ActR/RegA family two-component response regulator